MLINWNHRTFLVKLIHHQSSGDLFNDNYDSMTCLPFQTQFLTWDLTTGALPPAGLRKVTEIPFFLNSWYGWATSGRYQPVGLPVLPSTEWLVKTISTFLPMILSDRSTATLDYKQQVAAINMFSLLCKQSFLPKLCLATIQDGWGTSFAKQLTTKLYSKGTANTVGATVNSFVRDTTWVAARFQGNLRMSILSSSLKTEALWAGS